MVTITLPTEVITDCTRPGQPADDMVKYYLDTEHGEQFKAIPALNIMAYLEDYGAWDNEELQDDEQNLARLFWIVCGDLQDNSHEAGQEINSITLDI